MAAYRVKRWTIMIVTIGLPIFLVRSAAPNQARQEPQEPVLPVETDRLYLTQTDYELLEEQLKQLRQNMKPKHIPALIDMLKRHSDQLYARVFEADATCQILMSHIEPYWMKFAEPLARDVPDALLLKALVPFLTDPCSAFWGWPWEKEKIREFRLNMPSARRGLPLPELLTEMTGFRFVEEAGPGPRLTVKVARHEELYSVSFSVDQVYHGAGFHGFYRFDGQAYRSIYAEWDRRWETVCIRTDRPAIR